MGIVLHVLPGVTETWEAFCSRYPTFSVALDGFVMDRTRRSLVGPYANFDHHAGVDRIATRSTAEQVLIEINLGLFDTFKDGGIPTAHLYVNDCDEDTCLAVWLLKNHERVTGQPGPLVNRLVYMNDRLDTTSGSYPLGDTAMMRVIAWIFEPYQKLRAEKKLHLLKDAGVMESVIQAVCQRITDYTMGKAEERPLRSGLTVVSMHDGFATVEEEGPLARMRLYAGVAPAFLSVLGEGRYVLGRKSVWVDFPLERIFEALNKADPAATGGNVWGGSDTIGGSPRLSGSGLSLAEIESVIKGVITGAGKDDLSAKKKG